MEHVIELLDEGNTIPFIARYRKEAHGSLDDQELRELSERLDYLRGLEKRREEVRGLIDGLGALTEEVEAALAGAATLSEIEDIYRPYRPKRKTRASVAREKGLEPLAQAIYAQEKDSAEPLELAGAYINPERGWSRPRTPLRARSTLSPSKFPTTPAFASACAWSPWRRRNSPPKPPNRTRIRSMLNTMNTKSRSPKSPGTGCSPSTAESGRAFEGLHPAGRRTRPCASSNQSGVREGSPCTEAVRAAAKTPIPA